MKIFKIYGYCKDPSENEQLIELNQISFQADPEVLRVISDMLLKSASELENNSNDDWNHIHLQDEWSQWLEDYPDVVIVNPKLV